MPSELLWAGGRAVWVPKLVWLQARDAAVPAVPPAARGDRPFVAGACCRFPFSRREIPF